MVFWCFQIINTALAGEHNTDSMKPSFSSTHIFNWQQTYFARKQWSLKNNNGVILHLCRKLATWIVEDVEKGGAKCQGNYSSSDDWMRLTYRYSMYTAYTGSTVGGSGCLIRLQQVKGSWGPILPIPTSCYSLFLHLSHLFQIIWCQRTHEKNRDWRKSDYLCSKNRLEMSHKKI